MKASDYDFALTEIFNFYARKFFDKPAHFEQLHKNCFEMGIRGYITFVNDFKVPIDKQRVIEVWKKSAKDPNALTLDEFKLSLSQLATGSIEYQV